MRPAFLAAILVAATLFTAPVAAQTGSTPTTPTGVTRVTLIRIKDGHGAQFWTDMRQHLKPIYEEYKRRGIITDYAIANKLSSNSENDWGVVLTLRYPNYAALDDLAARTEPVTLAHYGTAEKRTAANAARTEHGTVVQSYLIRNVNINDWK